MYDVRARPGMYAHTCMYACTCMYRALACMCALACMMVGCMMVGTNDEKRAVPTAAFAANMQEYFMYVDMHMLHACM